MQPEIKLPIDVRVVREYAQIYDAGGRYLATTMKDYSEGVAQYFEGLSVAKGDDNEQTT